MARVRVVDTHRRPVPGAAVTVAADSANGPIVAAGTTAADGTFLLPSLALGIHSLRVAKAQLVPDQRLIRIRKPQGEILSILRPAGTHAYISGGVHVPFSPRPDLVGVALKGGATSGDLFPLVALSQVAKFLPTGLLGPELVRQERVAVVQHVSGPKADALKDLRALAAVKLAGPVVFVEYDRLVFIAPRAVAAFRAHITRAQAESIALAHGFQVTRALPYARNAFVLDHEASLHPDPTTLYRPYRILDDTEALLADDRVVWAEPDLVATATNHAAIPPIDDLYPAGEAGGDDCRRKIGFGTDFGTHEGQWHLLADEVNAIGAWNLLAGEVGRPTDVSYGDPEVRIAIVDEGVPSSAGVAQHPDFDGALSDHSYKVETFYDLNCMHPEIYAGDLMGADHGLLVAGLATALANNKRDARDDTAIGIAGVAPNCRMIAVRRPTTDSALRYADGFVWLAGGDPGWKMPTSDAGCLGGTVTLPAPLAPGADLAVNSYGVWDHPLPEYMQEAFEYALTFGRGGKGLVLLFSAGNGRAELTSTAPTGSHQGAALSPWTITVAAATKTEAAPGDRGLRHPTSNFGAALDVCAPSGTSGSDGTVEHKMISTGLQGGPGNPFAGRPGWASCDYQVFSETSAANAIAGGVVALMLSMDRDLNWIEARDCLRASANHDPSILPSPTDPPGLAWTEVDAQPFSPAYGYGRVDAGAAVACVQSRLRAKATIRDHRDDAGDVPSSTADWFSSSPDICVRSNDDRDAAWNAYDAEPNHQNPVEPTSSSANPLNYVHVRVRNFGPGTSRGRKVRVLVSSWPRVEEFRYPRDWISATHLGDPDPRVLLPASYELGEADLRDLGPDEIDTVVVPWRNELVPPAKVRDLDGVWRAWHPCLLAEVSPHDETPSTGPEPDVRRYRSLAQRNVQIDRPVSPPGTDTAVVIGTDEAAGVSAIVIDRQGMAPRDRVFVRLSGAGPKAAWEGKPTLPPRPDRWWRWLGPLGDLVDWLGPSDAAVVVRDGLPYLVIDDQHPLTVLPLRLPPGDRRLLIVGHERDQSSSQRRELRVAQHVGARRPRGGFAIVS